jgi:hypothetical protein
MLSIFQLLTQYELKFMYQIHVSNSCIKFMYQKPIPMCIDVVSNIHSIFNSWVAAMWFYELDSQGASINLDILINSHGPNPS